MVVKWCLAGTEGQRPCPPHHYTTSCIFVAKFLWACANCNLSFLLLADRHGRSVAFCRCCRPSASRFNVLFIQRCSKQSGCTLLTSGINKTLPPRDLLTGCFLFFSLFSVNLRDVSVISSFWNTPAWHQQACQLQSQLSLNWLHINVNKQLNRCTEWTVSLVYRWE